MKASGQTSPMPQSAPETSISRGERAVKVVGLLGAIAGAATVVFFANNVYEESKDIIRYSQFGNIDTEGLLNEIKDSTSFTNDLQGGNVDPNDLNSLIPKDNTNTGWTESRNLTPGPTDLPPVEQGQQ